MIDLRDLELLLALDRRRHFAKAAESCGISQPGFSSRVRNIEAAIGAPVVRRGKRAVTFTPEGEVVLQWARRIVADASGLREAIAGLRKDVSGTLTLGVVPSALAFGAEAAARLKARHPDLALVIRSMTAAQIRAGVADLSLDAGVTYLDPASVGDLAASPLFEERYVLIAPDAMAPRGAGVATWAEAAALPLCLLTKDMRNRQILDATFAAHAGQAPTPLAETTAFTVALALVAQGVAATIVPQSLARALPVAAAVARLPLVSPEIVTAMGVVTALRPPRPLAVAALRAAVAEMDGENAAVAQ